VIAIVNIRTIWQMAREEKRVRAAQARQLA
jgi:hypothetical protein